MDIKGVVSKTEDVFFFTASSPLSGHGVAECKSATEAAGSPLFTGLFLLPWVKEASVEGRALIVKKKEGTPSWDTLAPQVAALIRKIHQEKGIFIPDDYPRKKEIIKTPDTPPVNQTHISTPLGQKIQQILAEKIAPGLASHGGHASIIDLVDGKVYLYFGGGCQGCSQASVTVKDGIEKLLLREFPELQGVVDITDHSSGKNPFYK